MPIIISVVVWLALGRLAGRMFARKGYDPMTGVFLLTLLGPLGLAVSFLLPMTAAAELELSAEREAQDDARRGAQLKTCPRCGRKCGGLAPFCAGCNHRFGRAADGEERDDDEEQPGSR